MKLDDTVMVQFFGELIESYRQQIMDQEEARELSKKGQRNATGHWRSGMGSSGQRRSKTSLQEKRSWKRLMKIYIEK